MQLTHIMLKKEQLTNLGLSLTEAEVYLILLQEGTIQAGLISKKTKNNRTTVYQVLEKLVSKGLVSYVNRGKIKVFQATSAKRIVALQKEKVQLAEELLPQLESITKPAEEEVVVYKGRKGIRTIMQSILECKEYISFGSAGEFLEIMQHDFLLFQKEKRKRKIKSRVILGKSSKKKQIVTESYAKFKFIEDRYMTPTTTWVFENKVAIIMWSKNPLATLVQSETLAKSYHSYFELLWKQAMKNSK
jgi:HTH-type transcriptional regulator, sugar sensing transcriptional regulator